MKYMIGMVLSALGAYYAIQWELQVWGQPIDFYVNMITHMCGGMFTAAGILFIRLCINAALPSIPWVSFREKMHIPFLTLSGLLFMVLVIGLVWEVFEVVFKDSTFYSLDTWKDVMMDLLGALIISKTLGRFQHD